MRRDITISILLIISLIVCVGAVSAVDSVPGYTSSDGVTPDLIKNFNAVNCGQLGCAGTSLFIEKSNDAAYSGTYVIGNDKITLTASNGLIAWSSTAKINCIYIKGGNPSAGDNYDYSAYCYGGHEPISADSHLSTPLNPKNLLPHNISHIVICYEPKIPTPAPEFPSIFIPATMIIGFLGAVLFIQRTREH
jgi:hypothetical protein